MKQILVILFIALISGAKGAEPVDSVFISKTFNDGTTKIIAAIKGQTKDISDSLKAFVKPGKTEISNLQQPDSWSRLISFLPVFSLLAHSSRCEIAT